MFMMLKSQLPMQDDAAFPNLASPSPLPSPSGRGRTVARTIDNATRPGFSRNRLGFSLASVQRSADFQSALSPISTRQRNGVFRAPRIFNATHDESTAIQQRGNLRYNAKP